MKHTSWTAREGCINNPIQKRQPSTAYTPPRMDVGARTVVDGCAVINMRHFDCKPDDCAGGYIYYNIYIRLDMPYIIASLLTYGPIEPVLVYDGLRWPKPTMDHDGRH